MELGDKEETDNQNRISLKSVKQDQIARLCKVICQRVYTGSLQQGNVNVNHGAVIGKPLN